MEKLHILGLSFDQLMDVSAGTGICILFSILYVEAKGWVRPSYSTFISKLVGLALICAPLFLRWFLSASILLFLSITLIIVCVFYMYKRRRGI